MVECVRAVWSESGRLFESGREGERVLGFERRLSIVVSVISGSSGVAESLDLRVLFDLERDVERAKKS